MFKILILEDPSKAFDNISKFKTSQESTNIKYCEMLLLNDTITNNGQHTMSYQTKKNTLYLFTLTFLLITTPQGHVLSAVMTSPPNNYQQVFT
ncbi:hypothetical protein C0J52_00444 [Blattella germanica]|nr:hypothetical protein C0J52_00444 [Blattella germanica]